MRSEPPEEKAVCRIRDILEELHLLHKSSASASFLEYRRASNRLNRCEHLEKIRDNMHRDEGDQGGNGSQAAGNVNKSRNAASDNETLEEVVRRSLLAVQHLKDIEEHARDLAKKSERKGQDH